MSAPKRQVSCLSAVDGWKTMHMHDILPKPVRERLEKSPFNVCAACVIDYSIQMPHLDGTKRQLLAVEFLENKIRKLNDLEDRHAGLTPT